MPEQSAQPFGVSGGYSTWAHAVAASSTYTTDLVIYHQICDEIRNGRPSGRNIAPIITGLDAIRHPANVLDFGGNLGMVYFELNRIVPHRIASWTIVDLPDVCNFGAEQLADAKLRFTTQSDGLQPDLILASHILQYLEHPYRTLEKLAALEPNAIVLHEIPLALGETEYAVQNLIPQLGGGKRPVQSLSFNLIVQALPHFKLLSEYPLPDWAPGLNVKQVALLFVRS